MRGKQKFLALALSAAMSFALCLSASAAEEYEAKMVKSIENEDFKGKTVILHSNDVHGALDGYAYIKALKTAYEEKGAEVILADAGDFTQGTVYVSVSKGESAVTMMNEVGYDVATLGNHEFDFGYAQIKSNLEKAKFNVICADVREGDKTIYNPTYIYTTKSGVKVGFFGMETPEAQTKVNPALIQGLSFDSKEGLYKCTQNQVDALKKDGADVIVCLGHLGVDEESKPDGHRSVDVYAKTTGIDIMIDGHSHTVMTAGADGEPVQSTGTKFANIGVVVIDDSSKKIVDHYLTPCKETTTEKDAEGKDVEKVTFELPKDEKVAAAAKEIMDKVDEEYGKTFAKSEVDLNGAREPGNRTEETNLGDLITDAMAWDILKTEGSVTVPKENVVAITNGGGIRASISAGDISMKNVNAVLPFGNTVAVIYVTGSELLEALEASTYAVPGAIGGYPQTSGIKFTIDATVPFDQGPAYPESTYYKPASIKRVTIESINGKAFDPNGKYAVVTNNFCAAGGDTYYVFKNASAQFDTGIPLDEALMDYITTELKGVIGSKYANPRGDQTIITEKKAAEPEQPTPVDPTPVTPADPTPVVQPPVVDPAPVVEPTPVVDPTPVEPSPAPQRTYTVIKGDCLWKISQKVYGTGTKWGILYDANRDTIKNPNRISIGQILRIA